MVKSCQMDSSSGRLRALIVEVSNVNMSKYFILEDISGVEWGGFWIRHRHRRGTKVGTNSSERWWGYDSIFLPPTPKNIPASYGCGAYCDSVVFQYISALLFCSSEPMHQDQLVLGHIIQKYNSLTRRDIRKFGKQNNNWTATVEASGGSRALIGVVCHVKCRLQLYMQQTQRRTREGSERCRKDSRDTR